MCLTKFLSSNCNYKFLIRFRLNELQNIKLQCRWFEATLAPPPLLLYTLMQCFPTIFVSWHLWLIIFLLRFRKSMDILLLNNLFTWLIFKNLQNHKCQNWTKSSFIISMKSFLKSVWGNFLWLIIFRLCYQEYKYEKSQFQC
jgi:hypothetical protein